VAPLTAILIIPLLGMAAFAVDIGYIVLTQTDLQNAADSAALAGVQQLSSGYIQYNLPGQTSDQKKAILTTAQGNARTAAKNFASYNAAGGVSSLTLLDSDIEFGFTDASGNYTGGSAYTGYPNTVKVVMRRDPSANGVLNLFFGPILGTNSVTLTATAAATIYGGTIDSWPSGSAPKLLPVTYDVNHWNNFLSTGQDPDGNPNRVNNIPSLLIYPSQNFTGNFGWLSLDDYHASASALSTWINNGMTSMDYQALLDNHLVPLSKHTPTVWDWVGTTGFKQSDVSTVNALSGQTWLLPLFTPKDANLLTYLPGVGNGSSFKYNIVQFVAVKVVSSPGDQSITVQPAPYFDPNAIFNGGPAPVGTSSGLITTFTTPKLSQ
jgi:Flp pilus assembly protein TadG